MEQVLSAELICGKCTLRPLSKSELLLNVTGCSGFLIIRNSSLRVHFLCSVQEKKKERKSKILKTADIYFVTAGFLIK